MNDLLKIAHNVGHSEKDTPGKQSPDGVKEWTQANAICKLVMAELANYQGVGQKRFDDITGKVDIPLNKRWGAINDWGANVGIDYHLNAHGNGALWTDGNGVEVFVAESKPREALELAQKIQTNIVAATGFKDRGVKFENWDMVYFTKKTHVLVEMGFMTNKENTQVIRSTEGQRKIALAIASALVAQYGLKRSTPDASNTYSKPTNEIRYIQTGGYAGPALLTIHDYLKGKGHGYDVKRNSDWSLSFLIGPFDTGMANWKECYDSVIKIDPGMKPLTREQAAEWKK